MLASAEALGSCLLLMTERTRALTRAAVGLAVRVSMHLTQVQAPEVSRLRTERDQWRRRAQRLQVIEDKNQRLRGVVAALADGLPCAA